MGHSAWPRPGRNTQNVSVALEALLDEVRSLRLAMERQGRQMEELRRENAELRAALAARAAPAAGPPPHRLGVVELQSQDERMAAELEALTPRPDDLGAAPMLDPEDARGRPREAGHPTPEKPALKKPVRSVSEAARRHD